MHFSWGEFFEVCVCVCVLGWVVAFLFLSFVGCFFFFFLELRLTRRRNKTAYSGSREHFFPSPTPPLAHDRDLLVFQDWKQQQEEEQPCTWARVVIGKAVHEGTMRISEYRTNDDEPLSLLPSCCGSLVLFFSWHWHRVLYWDLCGPSACIMCCRWLPGGVSLSGPAQHKLYSVLLLSLQGFLRKAVWLCFCPFIFFILPLWVWNFSVWLDSSRESLRTSPACKVMFPCWPVACRSGNLLGWVSLLYESFRI